MRTPSRPGPMGNSRAVAEAFLVLKASARGALAEGKLLRLIVTQAESHGPENLVERCARLWSTENYVPMLPVGTAPSPDPHPPGDEAGEQGGERETGDHHHEEPDLGVSREGRNAEHRNGPNAEENGIDQHESDDAEPEVGGQHGDVVKLF